MSRNTTGELKQVGKVDKFFVNPTGKLSGRGHGRAGRWAGDGTNRAARRAQKSMLRKGDK